MLWLYIKRRRARIAWISGTFCLCVFYYLILGPPPPHNAQIHRPWSREFDRLAQFMNDGNASYTLVPSSFDWAAVPFRHLPGPGPSASLPTSPAHGPGSPRSPTIQYAPSRPESASAASLRLERRDAVRAVFLKGWNAYRKFAWGRDALRPVTGGSRDQFAGWAATLVDSLDSLWIMGFREEFDEAVAVVARTDFGVSSTPRVNTFETNIRYLGGLLAAYDLSGRDVLLAKAVELGNMLYAAFNTPTRMPVDFIDFPGAKTGEPLTIEHSVVSAAPGTLSLEMTRLAQLTGDAKYYDVVDRLMRLFHDQQNDTLVPGLWPAFVSMETLDLSTDNFFTLGGGADSLYEYLPKMHALTAGREPMYEEMTRAFVRAANATLFFRPMLPEDPDILISGTARTPSRFAAPSSSSAARVAVLEPESEHLTCFIGGLLALAGRLLDDQAYVDTGAKLTRGCAYVYSAFATGVMPERFTLVPCPSTESSVDLTCTWSEEHWEAARKARPGWEPNIPKGFTSVTDRRYLLRPEAVESLFVLHRVTGESVYRDLAWDMFVAINNLTATELANAAVTDVTGFESTMKEDYMESFWLAETLKYFYLIFSPPDVVSLDEFVLNTEAHPFRIPK